MIYINMEEDSKRRGKIILNKISTIPYTAFLVQASVILLLFSSCNDRQTKPASSDFPEVTSGTAEDNAILSTSIRTGDHTSDIGTSIFSSAAVAATTGSAALSSVCSSPVSNSTKTSKASSTSTSAAATTPPKEPPAMSKNDVELIGRFLKTGTSYWFAWSGSTISAGFQGVGIGIRLSIAGTVKNDYVNVRIDDRAPFVLELSRKNDSYILAEGLPSGYHSVSIEKRTEGMQSTLVFDGFDYMGGKPAPAPIRKSRRIELIGDSVTAGYGNAGKVGWTGYKMSEQDAAQTYGALAAAELNAEATIIAVSGQGMYQNLGGQTKPVMKDFYPRTLPNDASSNSIWNFQSNIPDVVVINLGTNDFASNVEPGNFIQAYLQFIQEVRSHYPTAYILCVAGPHNVGLRSIESVEQVVNTRVQEGDARISLCILALEPDDGLEGVDGHPSAKAHRLAAADLAACIREKMHW